MLGFFRRHWIVSTFGAFGIWGAIGKLCETYPCSMSYAAGVLSGLSASAAAVFALRKVKQAADREAKARYDVALTRERALRETPEPEKEEPEKAPMDEGLMLARAKAVRALVALKFKQGKAEHAVSQCSATEAQAIVKEALARLTE